MHSELKGTHSRTVKKPGVHLGSVAWIAPLPILVVMNAHVDDARADGDGSAGGGGEVHSSRWRSGETPPAKD